MHDVTGRQLERLHAGHATRGEHRVTVDASDYPSGVYYYRLQFEGHVLTEKAVLLN